MENDAAGNAGQAVDADQYQRNFEAMPADRQWHSVQCMTQEAAQQLGLSPYEMADLIGWAVAMHPYRERVVIA